VRISVDGDVRNFMSRDPQLWTKQMMQNRYIAETDKRVNMHERVPVQDSNEQSASNSFLVAWQHFGNIF
jgi:hypothetical protein